jgi:tetratricopeptide (TPR) repeat protein
MILRRLPEAAELAKLQPQETPVNEKLQHKGLPVQAISKLRPIMNLLSKKIWNFMLEAKDLKPAAIPGYKFKKIFGRRFMAQAKQQQATLAKPTTTAEIKGEKYFLELIRREPKNLSNYDALGRHYLEAENFSDAKDIYTYLTNHEATNSDYQARLAISLYQVEQYEKAVEHFHKSLSLDSSQPNRYYNLGLSLEAAGRTEEAIKAFAQALALEPANAKFHINLSNAYKKIGEMEKAEEVLRAMPKNLFVDKKVKVN